MLIEGLPLWLAQTNAWIVSAQGPGRECVLIDAPPDPSAIVQRLAHHGLRLVALFNTHGHIDHIGGVGTLVHDSDRGLVSGDLEVRIHDADKHMLLDPLGTSGMFGSYLEGLDLRPPETIYGLDDGQRITGAGMTFTTIHTPGHTQGSVCFRLDIEGEAPILFSGDHLFQGSIGRRCPTRRTSCRATAARRRSDGNARPTRSWSSSNAESEPAEAKRAAPPSGDGTLQCPRRDLNPHALAGKGF